MRTRAVVGKVSFGPSMEPPSPAAPRGTVKNPVTVHLPKVSASLLMLFDTSTPEGRHDAKRAQEGFKYWMILWELDQWLRTKGKHGPDRVAASEVRTYLYELMEEEGVRLVE